MKCIPGTTEARNPQASHLVLIFSRIFSEKFFMMFDLNQLLFISLNLSPDTILSIIALSGWSSFI